MNLRLLAANLHDWFQRRVSYPSRPDPESSVWFAYFIVFLAFIAFFVLMQFCSGEVAKAGG
jgi:hypothetical protein